MLFKLFKQGVFVSVALMLSACVTMGTMGDQTVLISDQVVQQKLNERLSVPISLLKIFNLQLSNTKVAFDEASNRMRVSLDSDLTSSLFKDHYTGNAVISGVVDYDAEQQAVVLKEPAVETLAFDELNTKQVDLFSAFAKVIGSEMLNDLVLYKVDPADLNVNGTQYAPKSLNMTAQGLQITLSPEK